MINKHFGNMQVDANVHYKFANYITKGRWISFWHQIDEVVKLNPKNVLEIGVGSRVFMLFLQHLNISFKSVDIDPLLRPDYVASVMKLPIKDNLFDVVTCFQVLEHLPFDNFIPALREIARVSSKHVILSLPDAQCVWTYSIHVPKIQNVCFHLPRPQWSAPKSSVCKDHLWEINMKIAPLKRIIKCIEDAKLALIKTYRVPENPYHRFFICKINN